jgi:hypothetical protein
MSGILDSKSRIIDVIVTQEGRRQIADGKLEVRYVSFTDAATFYKADIASGSADATTRLYLEQCNLPQDQITFEADDSGALKPFKNSSNLSIRAGQFLEYSFPAVTGSLLGGSIQGTTILSGTQFASTAETLLQSSMENFKRLRAIATKDLLFEDDEFLIGNKNITFTITNDRPIAKVENHAMNVNHLPSLFNDPRLASIKNFAYLPPINKLNGGIPKPTANLTQAGIDESRIRAARLGNYPPWGPTSIKKDNLHKQLMHELKLLEEIGYVKTLSIDPTSRNNSLIGQFFEIDHDQMRKLDILEFGQFKTGDPKFPISHIFFIGRVLVDDNGTHTFVHLFTLVFD